MPHPLFGAKRKKGLLYWKKGGQIKSFSWPGELVRTVRYQGMKILWVTTSLPPWEKLYFVPGTFLSVWQKSFAPKSGWGMLVYMPQDGYWLASFKVIPPPPTQKVSFSAAKKWKFPALNKRDEHTPITFEKKISALNFFLLLFRLFLSVILSRWCRLSRTTSDPHPGSC